MAMPPEGARDILAERRALAMLAAVDLRQEYRSGGPALAILDGLILRHRAALELSDEAIFDLHYLVLVDLHLPIGHA
jgi:hypothetical protein